MHRTYWEEVHPILFLQLILNGILYKHLADVNDSASEMLDRLVKQMGEQEGITEHLKAEAYGMGGKNEQHPLPGRRDHQRRNH